jgi:hypothetical protein
MPTGSGRAFNALVLCAGAADLAFGLSQLGRQRLGALAFGLFGAPGLWPWDPIDAGVLRLDDLDAIDLRALTVDSTGYRYRNAALGLVVRGGPRLQPLSHPDEAPALRQARQLQQPLGLRLRDRRLHRTS